MWLLELILLMAAFSTGFFFLIRSNKQKFEKTGRLAQVFLGIIAFCLIFLLVDSAFGGLFLFFLLFGALAGASYFLFLKRSKKAGFIGLCFCLTFAVVFTYLQFFLLNFDF